MGGHHTDIDLTQLHASPVVMDLSKIKNGAYCQDSITIQWLHTRKSL